MELSIVVLHHNSPEEVRENLEALEKALLPDRTEVFVVNNGGKNANEKINFRSKKFELKFFEIANLGYSNGNNFALAMAKGKYLCILNPDIIVEKNTLIVLLDFMRENPRVGLCGPRLRYPDNSIQDNYRVFPKILDLIIKRTFLRKIFVNRMRHYLMWDKDPQETEPVDWLTGAFQIFSRRCWEEVSPNDERFFLFMSDVDVCRRAWDKNFEVYFVGNAEALHNDAKRLSGGGFLDIFRKKVLRIHLMDAVKYYAKYLGKSLPKKSPSRT